MSEQVPPKPPVQINKALLLATQRTRQNELKGKFILKSNHSRG